jgi:hypothetical protein
MKKLAFVLLLIPAVALSMTRYADGSILLTPEEVKNVEKNFDQMQQTINDAIEIIEGQQKEIEMMQKPGKCI